MRYVRLLVFFSLIVLLAACGGGGSSPAPFTGGGGTRRRGGARCGGERPADHRDGNRPPGRRRLYQQADRERHGMHAGRIVL